MRRTKRLCLAPIAGAIRQPSAVGLPKAIGERRVCAIVMRMHDTAPIGAGATQERRFGRMPCPPSEAVGRSSIANKVCFVPKFDREIVNHPNTKDSVILNS